MNISLKTIAALVTLGLGLGTLVSLSAPADTRGFSLLGGSLNVAQRDFRVFNNFSNSAANNNDVEQANFPGATGAVLAIWKGHVEWASEPYAGNGAGDPIGGNVLGSGGANFDNIYQGEANNGGNSNSNVHAELQDSTPGSTLAFMQGPISDGWIIRYLSAWAWHDGPADIPFQGGSGFDIQSVACHEIGHSLGLDHSNNGGATMAPSTAPGSEAGRSINFDDVAGVQAIYGVASPGKPRITGLSGSTSIGGVLTIHGENFPDDNNVVWFTAQDSDGTPAKVNMVSATNNGTRIDVTVPAGVQDGEVMVKIPMVGNDSLTNAWPIDIGDPIANLPTVDNVSPNVGPEGGFTDVVITGTNLGAVTSVTFGGVEVLDFTVDGPTQISAVTPPGSLFSNVTVAVSSAEGTGTLPNAFIYSTNPPPDVATISPAAGPVSGGTQVTISGNSVVGVTQVTFGGTPGTALQILAGDELSVVTPPGSDGPVDVVVSGNGNDTLVDGFEYQAGGEFIDIGPGLGGALGVPSYTGMGDLTPGSLVGYSTTLSNAQPGVLAILFVGLTEGAQPLKQGTLYAFPFLLSVQANVPGSGTITLPSSIDAGTPSGLEIIAQWWVADPTGPAGATASNGLKLVIP